jgi:hypothetical protein
MTDEELLEYLYHKKKNYGGINQLYNKAKIAHPGIRKEFVKEWLNEQKNYQLNKVEKVGKKKEFLPIYSEIPFNFQIDLTFFPRYKKYNNGYYVLFTAININTRFVYAYYSKDKSMEEILKMLKLMEKKTIINAITCDEGKEFVNNEFKNFCSENKIIIYYVKGDSHKLGIINRFHRTLKDTLKNYFVDNNLKWVDVIDDIIYNYNHTVNSGIGIEPYKVTNAIENNIINEKRNITEHMKENIVEQFKVGDYVRILRKKKIFEDKLLPKYFDIVFIIKKIKSNRLVIHDLQGNEYETKKEYCYVINPNNEIAPESKIIKASKENRLEKELKKLYFEEEEIVKEKRMFV